MKNIEYQYLMKHAMEEVSKLNIAKDIAIAEKILMKWKSSKGGQQK